DIEVRSGGKFHGNVVSVRVNGHELVDRPRRGYTLVALAPEDGTRRAGGRVDTSQSAQESRRMAAAVERLPNGSIVVAAVKHDGGGQLEVEGLRAPRAIGARGDLAGTRVCSHPRA